MPKQWRPFIGPAITLVLAALILWADRSWFRVPNPGALTFLAIAFSAYFGGTVSGLASAAIAIGYSFIHFSPPGRLFDFKPDDFARLLVLSVCAPACAILIGLLQSRVQQALLRERRLNRELGTLRAALDQSEVGVVLLDGKLRAQFINRAFRRLWRLADAFAESKPAYPDLMRHGRETKAVAAPAEGMEAAIAERTALVRAGDEKPRDIRLTSGDVLRCRCKALADGGRMLTFGNVSDLVRNADEYAELAMKDALTGIYNRRHFMTRLQSEWSRYRRYRRPLAILMLDIDHFKSINDRYGHDVGDKVIIAVATLCNARVRDSDLAARIGGEEFAVLLPEATLEDACVAGERLRQAVAARPVTVGDLEVAVTVSIGAAQVEAAMSDSAELVKRSDEALYAAKHGGRNRVACALGNGSYMQPVAASAA